MGNSFMFLGLSVLCPIIISKDSTSRTSTNGKWLIEQYVNRQQHITSELLEIQVLCFIDHIIHIWTLIERQNTLH